MSLAIRSGRPRSVPSPETANADPDLDVARRLPTTRIVGTPDHVVVQLDDLAAATSATELMVSTVTHGLDERLRSLTLLTEAWNDPARSEALEHGVA